MRYRVGIDIGGTFTDFALLKGAEVILHKNLSTPEDRSIGVMEGLKKLAEIEGLTLGDFLGQCDAIVHGTTIADNTLIEMNGAVTGLITTEGFRDEIEYRRGFKEDIWDVRLEPPQQITPRRRRLTVPERILFDGSVYKALDEDAVRECCRRLRKQNVESVAISLLFSFVNPAHEKRVAEIVAEEMPGVQISASHEVLPRAPEYDRTSTTVVNAYVAPRVTSYLEKLVARLKEAGYHNQLMVMQASGGVMTKEYIEGSPIRVLASGPAGGVIGSAHVGVAKGYPESAVRRHGRHLLRHVGRAERRRAGRSGLEHAPPLPGRRADGEGRDAGRGRRLDLPRQQWRAGSGTASAGAEPGPICYGRGGTQPTITDALLMLGILSADSEFRRRQFFAVHATASTEAFQKIGEQMGYSAEDAAFDCWRVVNANMSQGVRRTTAGKGIDPEDMVMLAYGGNGPAFAAIQAEDLGIDKVLVPKASPTFSALGTLVANPSIDEERSYIAPANALDVEQTQDAVEELGERAEKYFADAQFLAGQRDGQLPDEHALSGAELVADLRCADSSKVSQDLSFVDDGIGERAIDAFNKRHMEEYGHIREGEMPEMTGVRLATSVATPSPNAWPRVSARPPSLRSRRRAAAPISARVTRRPNVFLGAALKPGHEVMGPAIIEETFTTIVVYPGWKAHVDDAGDYELTRAALS